MRKVVLYHLQSLDGVGEEPGDWMTDGSPEIFDNLGKVMRPRTTSCLVAGPTTTGSDTG